MDFIFFYNGDYLSGSGQDFSSSSSGEEGGLSIFMSSMIGSSMGKSSSRSKGSSSIVGSTVGNFSSVGVGDFGSGAKGLESTVGAEVSGSGGFIEVA